MSSGCEGGGWPGSYPGFCGYQHPTPPPPPPPQWSPHHHHHHHIHHPHHHYHHHHLHRHPQELCSTPQGAPPPAPPPLVTYAEGGVLPPCPPHYWDGDDLIDAYGRVVRRKTSANKKERRRTQSINNAFAELRECIPNVPADTKLSKIKTLRLATSYIAYLMEVLQCEDGGSTDPASQTAPTTSSAISLLHPSNPFTTTNNNNNSTMVTAATTTIAQHSRIHDKDDSDMETDPITPPGDGGGGGGGIASSSTTSPSNCSTSSSTIASSSTSPSDLPALEKRRGRTGWPETVWAQELKH